MLEILVDSCGESILPPFGLSSAPGASTSWGRNDPIFSVEGAMAYQCDLRDVEFHLLDSGHFALEDCGYEIQNALNQQINDDYCSWYFYRSAAAYCHEINLTGLGKWLRHRSEKKRDQAFRLRPGAARSRRGRSERGDGQGSPEAGG